jgi:RNA polymerase sigma-70 factor (ECF subfamily)
LIGILRDPQQAADALQSTLVKAIEQGQTSAEETRRAWLFRVAYHEALATRRRANTHDRVLRVAAWQVAEGVAKAGESAESTSLRRERAEIVRRAIQQLTPQQQTVVRMRMHENKTFAQIAAELGIPMGTAQTRMHAALAKLRAALGNDFTE